MKQQTLLTLPEQVGKRIDLVLSSVFEITRSSVQQLAEKGCILCNDKPVSKNYKVCDRFGQLCVLECMAEHGVEECLDAQIALDRLPLPKLGEL